MHQYEPGLKPGWREDRSTPSVLVVEAAAATATPLRRIAPDFSDVTVLSSPNALEALTRLDRDAIGVVAVDVDDPSVRGIVLLQVLAKLHPTVIRVAMANPESPTRRTASRRATPLTRSDRRFLPIRPTAAIRASGTTKRTSFA